MYRLFVFSINLVFKRPLADRAAPRVLGPPGLPWVPYGPWGDPANLPELPRPAPNLEKIEKIQFFVFFWPGSGGISRPGS